MNIMRSQHRRGATHSLPPDPSDNLGLRRCRKLPQPPHYKPPTSPTMPLAKLKLRRDLINCSSATGSDPGVTSGRSRNQVSPVPRFSREHALLYQRSSLPGSPLRARPTGSAFLEHYVPPQSSLVSHRTKGSSQPDLSMGHTRRFPSITDITKPPFLEPTYSSDRLDSYSNYDQYYRTRQHQLQTRSEVVPLHQTRPVSSVPSASSYHRPSTATGTERDNVDHDPRSLFKKQLKYFVEERRDALDTVYNRRHLVDHGHLDHVRSQHDHQGGHHGGSDSDLNALMHLYSHPPDPTITPGRVPQAGYPAYQSVPQVYTSPVPPSSYGRQHGYEQHYHPHHMTSQQQLHHHRMRSKYSTSSPSLLGTSPTQGLPDMSSTSAIMGYTQAGILRRSPSPYGQRSVDFDLSQTTYVPHRSSFSYGSYDDYY
ncbi:hypothetical protein HDE_02178 [Halotydeus destructor]|nr:hypothetical protein HDE_02178 [Halotydeus destructor]